jgi:hypothetical protein
MILLYGRQGFVCRQVFMLFYIAFWAMRLLMKKSDYILWLGMATAAGTALGMLSDRKHPAKGSLLGATAGMVAGSVAAGVYQYISTNRIPYYSAATSLYDDLDLI